MFVSSVRIAVSLSEPHLVKTMISLSVYIYIPINMYRTSGLLVLGGHPVNALHANIRVAT